MRLEINERGSKEYYEETLYILTNYKKINKKPNRKVLKINTYLLFYNIFLVLCIGMMLWFYISGKDIIYIFLMGMFFMFLCYSIYYGRIFKKQMKTMMNDTSTIIINIGENGVDYKGKDRSFTLGWNDISNVIINKYSIAFIPKEANSVLITISKKYKDSIVEALEKYSKEYLLVDNSSLY